MDQAFSDEQTFILKELRRTAEQLRGAWECPSRGAVAASDWQRFAFAELQESIGWVEDYFRDELRREGVK